VWFVVGLCIEPVQFRCHLQFFFRKLHIFNKYIDLILNLPGSGFGEMVPQASYNFKTYFDFINAMFALKPSVMAFRLLCRSASAIRDMTIQRNLAYRGSLVQAWHEARSLRRWNIALPGWGCQCPQNIKQGIYKYQLDGYQIDCQRSDTYLSKA